MEWIYVIFCFISFVGMGAIGLYMGTMMGIKMGCKIVLNAYKKCIDEALKDDIQSICQENMKK